MNMVEDSYKFFSSFIEDRLLSEIVDEEHMEKHYLAYKNLLTLAEYLFLSKNYVNSIFSNEFGFGVLENLVGC